MSSTYSAALADSVSDSNEQGCERSRSAKLSPTAEPCSLSTGLESPATEMSASSRQLDLLPMESMLTSSAADSLAKTSASQERELVLQARGAVSGANTRDSLANYDHVTSSWRTSQLCLVEGLEKFSETWPRSGMTRNGTAYRLPTLAPLTDETEFGSWPTPTAQNAKHTGLSPSEADRVRRGIAGLHSMVHVWPTPTTRDWKDGSAKACANVPVNGLLGRAVHQFSTPRTTPRTAREYDGTSPLGIGGLNPAWVEWLMGFPLGWTVLRPSETPSSRRSPKSSGGQS
jgi:hypothetical protein